jgi:uncharacterized protein YjbI with pentapeptide repeats
LHRRLPRIIVLGLFRISCRPSARRSSSFRAKNRDPDRWRIHDQGTILSGAHLNDADLSDAHLEGATLSGAHLKSARATGTNFHKVHLDNDGQGFDTAYGGSWDTTAGVDGTTGALGLLPRLQLRRGRGPDTGTCKVQKNVSEHDTQDQSDISTTFGRIGRGVTLGGQDLRCERNAQDRRHLLSSLFLPPTTPYEAGDLALCRYENGGRCGRRVHQL